MMFSAKPSRGEFERMRAAQLMRRKLRLTPASAARCRNSLRTAAPDHARRGSSGSHRSILCGRDIGQPPADIESRRAHVIWLALSFLARRVLTIRTPMGRKMRAEVRAAGRCCASGAPTCRSRGSSD